MKISQYLIGLLAVSILIFGISCNEDFFSPQDQFNTDQMIITEYLDNQGVQTQTDSIYGIHYRIIESGNDTVPTSSERFNLDYTITELGKEVVVLSDSNKTFTYSSILPGMAIMMPYVEENGTIEMYLPSGYAFREQSLTNLAPHTPVVVTINLNKIIRTEEEQYAYDQYLIEQHLVNNNLEASLDTASGLRYIIEEPGDGFKPVGNSSMKVNYEGKIMDGRIFDKDDDVLLGLNRVIEGWQILMPKIAEGGKIIMFIPSKYGYGETALPSIPAYSILRFEVELIELPQ